MRLLQWSNEVNTIGVIRLMRWEWRGYYNGVMVVKLFSHINHELLFSQITGREIPEVVESCVKFIKRFGEFFFFFIVMSELPISDE